jgi:hypothetical protein
MNTLHFLVSAFFTPVFASSGGIAIMAELGAGLHMSISGEKRLKKKKLSNMLKWC